MKYSYIVVENFGLNAGTFRKSVLSNNSQLTKIYYDMMVLVYPDIFFAIIIMHKCQWSDCSNRAEFKLQRNFNAALDW